MSDTKYRQLTRLGRNLRPGDEILVSEDLGQPYPVRGRVRVVEVRKSGRNYFNGRQQWTIHHTGPVAGNLTRHLWDHGTWAAMRCESDDVYDIMRPIG